MSKQTRWIVVDFDCWHGCNNREFNPGCDESSIRIKIDEAISEKFELFEKYMKMPCPRCGKVGEQKRSGWWDNITDDTKLSDPDPAKGSFSLSKVQDYTTQMLKARKVWMKRDIVAVKEDVKHMKEVMEALKTEIGRR